MRATIIGPKFPGSKQTTVFVLTTGVFCGLILSSLFCNIILDGLERELYTVCLYNSFYSNYISNLKLKVSDTKVSSKYRTDIVCVRYFDDLCETV